MRLRGSIEADIEWREPELDCTGMPRPDGRGLRLRFSGPLPGAGELAIVFAAPGLGMGVSARGVPVNVTLLDEAGERIYGTQGDSRCQFDEVEQRALGRPIAAAAELPRQRKGILHRARARTGRRWRCLADAIRFHGTRDIQRR